MKTEVFVSLMCFAFLFYLKVYPKLVGICKKKISNSRVSVIFKQRVHEPFFFAVEHAYNFLLQYIKKFVIILVGTKMFEGVLNV